MRARSYFNSLMKEIVSYLSSEKHSIKPKGWIVCVTVNQEHWNRLLYPVSELTLWGLIQQISANTHFYLRCFFIMGTHLTDLPPV